ncbi:hypothetical protein PC117_g3820 [Phytophthora cactorum]|uniref:Uncharacterized protein n=1 Tax=Phytophthora cactorum TaxID=29920 RepID=A0A8T1E9H8_9STRA|nr:hypothetical protein PC117_g3820 [Phytophthora cactorum]
MFGCGFAYSESSTYKQYWAQNFGRSNTEKVFVKWSIGQHN